MKNLKYALNVAIVFALVFAVAVTAVAAEANINIYAGTGDNAFKEGKLLASTFFFPYGLAADKDGGLLIADSYNNLIRKASGGNIVTIAGMIDKKDDAGLPLGEYKEDKSGNKEATKSKLNHPRDVAVDSSGNIFVADTENNCIRKIWKDGNTYRISLFAGANVFEKGTGALASGYVDGRGAPVRFNMPSGIAIDSSDNIYVADTMNNVIRMIAKNGTVTTFAGKQSANGGYKDGDAAAAQFNEPSDVAVSKDGKTVYVLDCANQLVRSVSGGKVTTLAGVKGDLIPDTTYYEGGYKNGANDAAKFNFPKGMCLADDGTIFIADTKNHRVRAIRPDGNVVTVVGNGTPGRGDGPVSDAMLNEPVGVLYSNEKLYISDKMNNMIRSIPANLDSLNAVVDVEDTLKELGIDISAPAASNTEIKVFYNKQAVAFTGQKPVVQDNKLYVPIKEVVAAWGGDLKYVAAMNWVRVSKGSSYFFIFKYDKKTKNVIGLNGRMMVEISYLVKNLKSMNYIWVSDYNVILLSKK